MTREMRAQVLDCLEWDRARIDEIRASTPLSDAASVKLNAVREHLDQYTMIIDREEETK